MGANEHIHSVQEQHRSNWRRSGLYVCVHRDADSNSYKHHPAVTVFMTRPTSQDLHQSSRITEVTGSIVRVQGVSGERRFLLPLRMRRASVAPLRTQFPQDGFQLHFKVDVSASTVRLSVLRVPWPEVSTWGDVGDFRRQTFGGVQGGSSTTEAWGSQGAVCSRVEVTGLQGWRVWLQVEIFLQTDKKSLRFLWHSYDTFQQMTIPVVFRNVFQPSLCVACLCVVLYLSPVLFSICLWVPFVFVRLTSVVCPEPHIHPSTRVCIRTRV